ncbi:MAG TPA: hypothetical protein VM900_08655 [Sphingomonas sp.]|nr:hypothetical protein [Sphingomonas sp.]
MAARRSEIAIQFKAVPHSMFAGRGGLLQPNMLIIRLQPEEYVQLLVMAKEPGLDREGVRLREVPLNLSLDAAFAGSRRRIASIQVHCASISSRRTNRVWSPSIRSSNKRS